VVDGKILLTASSGPAQDKLHVLCFDAASGSLLWQRELRATGRTMAHEKTAVAAPAPCSDGKRVFALWSCNDLVALDLDGNLLWTRGLTSDYPNVSNSLGMASSPLVVDNTLVAVVENDSESYSLGIDADTGLNLWKLERPKNANWTSPVLWKPTADANPVVLLQSSKGLLAVAPRTGSALWSYDGGASTMSSSASAEGHGLILVPSNGLTALRPAPNNAPPEQLWNARALNPATVSPLVLGSRVLSTNNAGVLSCANLSTGEAQWKLRLTGPFSSSPVGAGSTLLIVSEKGLVQTADISGSEGRLLGTLQLPLRAETKELVLGTPALSGQRVFVRTESTLWCLGGS
jgi:outer membrane protein assembly factor BamB